MSRTAVTETEERARRMVNFRLTRAQRAATHNNATPAPEANTNGSNPGGRDSNHTTTATSTRPADEAPYYRIEERVNQFAGPTSNTTANRNGSNSERSAVEEDLDPDSETTVRTSNLSSAKGGSAKSGGDSSASDLQNQDRDTAAARAAADSGPNSPKRHGVLARLLDSPRRRILGRMSANSVNGSGNTSSAAAAASAGGSEIALPPSAMASGPSAPSGAGRLRQQLQQVAPHPGGGDIGKGGRKGADDDGIDEDEEEGNLKLPAIAVATTAVASSSSYPYQETNRPTPSYLTTTPLFLKKSGTVPPPPASVQSKYADPANILEWLHTSAPGDILPRVLSFAGSRRIAVLSLTSSSWRRLCLSESVWRVACEDTGKYRPGIDPYPRGLDGEGKKGEDGAGKSGAGRGTWLQHYRDNPLVPVDYDTIQAAFYRSGACTDGEAGGAGDVTNQHPTVPRHRRNLRVLLKPATYVLKEALVVHANGKAEVTIETVDGPSERMVQRKWMLQSGGSGIGHGGGGISRFGRDIAAEGAAAASVRSNRSASASVSAMSSSGSTKRRLRDLLSCRSATGVSGETNDLNGMDFDPSSSSANSDDLSEASASASYYQSRAESLPTNLPQDPDLYHDGCYPKYAKRRAVLVLKTRKPNEPLVRVRQGTLRLRDVAVVHNATGTDIWNGNAAVQVQPPFDEAGEYPVETAPPNVPATAYVDSCDITSLSGRGLVTIDGGKSTITNSHVHHCAATGIYIGGPTSEATIRGTDVVRNGYGNQNRRVRRDGITRGHSGVYLEQGTASLRDCNVSHNALTGISAVSAENAVLDVRNTDLVSNETMQLEMPPDGSRSYRRSISRDNRIVQDGSARTRSGLVPPEHANVSSPNTIYNSVAEGAGFRRRRRRGHDEGLPQSPSSDADDEESGVGSPV